MSYVLFTVYNDLGVTIFVNIKTNDKVNQEKSIIDTNKTNHQNLTLKKSLYSKY